MEGIFINVVLIFLHS